MVPVMTTVFVVALVVVLVSLNRYHARASRQISDEGRTYWWERRKRDRDDLLDTARNVVSQGGFRAQRRGESAWTYAKAFDRWSAKQLNMAPTSQWETPYEQTNRRLSSLRLPQMPRFMKDTSFSTWTTIQTYWWSTRRGALVHRVVALKHDGSETFVLRCDHDDRVVPQLVDQHLDGAGPVLTCLRCFGMPRT